MEISRMKLTAIAGICFFAASPCYATGGDSYEYPASLSDTLDMLPGKSLGEIFFETSTIHRPAESWDSSKARELADRLGKEPLPQLLKTADDLDKQAESATGPIKANWLYLCGATRFSSGDRTECQTWFDRVIKEFPKSP